MAIETSYKIIKNKQLANGVYFMRLQGETSCFYAPGQFINIKLAGLYLRRPISVCDWREGSLDIIYKVVGKGTAQMAAMPYGEKLCALAGLGNGFTLPKDNTGQQVIVGGGVGVPPLYGLCKALVKKSIRPYVVLGFKSQPDVFYRSEFSALGCAVQITTEDGTSGLRGFVTDVLRPMLFDYYYSCGPMPMLRAVHALGEEKGAAGQLSFEERMGCGFGACMGCSCETLAGPKRICVEGPVMQSKEVVFK